MDKIKNRCLKFLKIGFLYYNSKIWQVCLRDKGVSDFRNYGFRSVFKLNGSFRKPEDACRFKK